MANNAIMVFDGTPTTVLLGATAVLADTTYSVSGATATYTEFDNSSDLWPLAKATFKGTYTAAPDTKTTLDLYYTENDLAGDAADDELPPTTSDRLGARYVGSFTIPSTGTSQYNMQIIISILGFQKGYFHLYNGGGDTLEITPTAWTVEVEGFTYTPST